MKTKITEKDKVHEEWYREVKQIKSSEDAKKFIQHLRDDYHHDYGTIVHACCASMLAGFHAMDSSPQGGITGFQAGCIGWKMIEEFMSVKAPSAIMNYRDMLYPQYEQKFQKTITNDTWKLLQKEAKKNLKEEEHSHKDVRKHWEDIVAGKIPFGYTIRED